MDETYFDEGPAGNFETSILEITRETDMNELNNQNSGFGVNAAKKNKECEGQTYKQVPPSKDISNIPFRHIDIHSFFSDRSEVIERALRDCQECLINNEENDIVGSWLLTKISLWDVEKERLVILTKKALYCIKYDFISLKILEHNQVLLSEIDTVVFGDLVYPPSSFVPRLSGLADGVSSIIYHPVRQEWSTLASTASFAQFGPRKRHMPGIRIMWNKGNPLPFSKQWNPFAKDIPWLTYASHPLYWYKGSEAEKAKFNVDGLYISLKDSLPTECNIKNGLIIIENYFGLGALIHNRNGLGFFKIRGKVSF